MASTTELPLLARTTVNLGYGNLDNWQISNHPPRCRKSTVYGVATCFQMGQSLGHRKLTGLFYAYWYWRS